MKHIDLLFAFIIISFISGCGEYHSGSERTRIKNIINCQAGSSEKRADFILKCIANANPKSDEEPEDWIRNCQTMAEQTFCKKQSMTITERCIHTSFGNCNIWEEISRQIATTHFKSTI